MQKNKKIEKNMDSQSEKLKTMSKEDLQQSKFQHVQNSQKNLLQKQNKDLFIKQKNENVSELQNNNNHHQDIQKDDYQKQIDRMVQRQNQIQKIPNRQIKPESIIQLKRSPQKIPSLVQQKNKNEEETTYVFEPAKKLSILDQCQVLVIGAGPSGISAAISSARAGVDTILIERYGCFGGVITTVGIETLAWYRYEGTTDSEGIGVEMERLAAKMGATCKFPYNESECLDAEFFKVVADHLIKESKVRPLLYTTVVECIMEKNQIKGVIVETVQGRQAVLAKRVIDCTGNADVAWYSGARCRKVSLKEQMSVTQVFSVSGIDKEKFLKYTNEKKRTYNDWGDDWCQDCTQETKQLRTPYLEQEFIKAKEEGIIPKDCENLCGSWSSLTNAGEATGLNIVHLRGYNALQVKDLTKAAIDGRQKTMYALQAMKKYIPGFDKAKLRNFGMTLGIRDTRKIIGSYNLTREDVFNQARFEKSVGIFPEFIDGYNILVLPTSGRYFQIPFGCILPEKIDNLLVAGRCCAGDMASHAAMRNMMACTVTGQGAGVVAAVSVLTQKNDDDDRSNEVIRNVDFTKVHEELKRQSVRYL